MSDRSEGTSRLEPVPTHPGVGGDRLPPAAERDVRDDVLLGAVALLLSEPVADHAARGKLARAARRVRVKGEVQAGEPAPPVLVRGVGDTELAAQPSERLVAREQARRGALEPAGAASNRPVPGSRQARRAQCRLDQPGGQRRDRTAGDRDPARRRSAAGRPDPDVDAVAVLERVTPEILARCAVDEQRGPLTPRQRGGEHRGPRLVCGS